MQASNNNKGENQEIDTQLITKLLQEAVRKAVLMHKRLGNTIATWENSKVAWIQTENIVVADEEETFDFPNDQISSPIL